MFLTAITMLFIGIAVCNIAKADTVFEKYFEASGSVENIFYFPEAKYRQEYKDILEEDDSVSRVVELEAIYSLRCNFIKDDAEIGSLIYFVTEKSDKKLENFVPETTLTEAEIAAFSHPIWLPGYFKYSQKFEVGDPFILIINGREYPFEIAGFYNTGFMNETSIGLKCVISEADYHLLSAVMEEIAVLGYNYDASFSADEYIGLCSERSGENVSQYCSSFTKSDQKEQSSWFINLYMYFLIAAAIVTMISCLFMIRHKISNDIEDQMQSIGVLEALGYRSKEISLAYIFEYLITGAAGALLGVLLIILTDPLLDRIIEGMIGYRVYGSINLGPQLVIMCVLVLIIVLSALGKARAVKKYPPVVAFRKGINSHHFGKNHLPLSKTKGNVNLRLSMKELFGNTKQSVGIMVCILATATAIIFGYSYFEFLKDGTMSIMTLTGMEAGDVRMELGDGVDPYEIRKTILELPEVRKALVTYPDDNLYVRTEGKNTDSLTSSLAMAFDDFEETENIHLVEGRYPKHDNEIMIGYGRADREEYSIGDRIVIKGDGTDCSYVITGIVNTMSNGGRNLYFTLDGLNRVFPAARPSVIEIYLDEGADRFEFGDKLTALYGTSVEDIIDEGVSADNLEDRIRQVADEKMAQLISLYGVTDVDYAIKIGDTVITGNSRRFILSGVSSYLDLAEGQLGPVAVGMKAAVAVIVIASVVVAAVILSSLAGTTVRRKRKELGIMKAMGYTSKDLMQQIAFRMMPIALAAVIIASVCAVFLQKAFCLVMFSVILDVNYLIIIPIDICILLFCYLVTYISAGKIKEISVTELMTE